MRSLSLLTLALIYRHRRRRRRPRNRSPNDLEHRRSSTDLAEAGRHQGRADQRIRRAPPARRPDVPSAPRAISCRCRENEDGDRVEKQQVAGEVMETVKLGGIIAPLHFDSGAI